jgi:hypothetical protein
MIFEDESYLGCYKNHFVGTKTDFDGQRSCELNHSDKTGLWKMRVTLFLELHNNLTNLFQLQKYKIGRVIWQIIFSCLPLE